MQKPSRDTTGPSGSGLRPQGSVDIRQDGYVLEDVDIQGNVEIHADNVTIRNFRINTTHWFGIDIKGGAKNTLIEDGEITGPKASGIRGSNYTARRLHVHNMGADAFKAVENVLIEQCLIEDLGYISKSHADGVQVSSGGNIMIQWNCFDLPHNEPGFKNSHAVIIQTDFGPVDDVFVADNWINGGGFSVQSRLKKHGTPTNVSIVRNIFGRQFLYGPWKVDGDVRIGDNKWEDTGKIILGQTTGGGTASEPTSAPEPVPEPNSETSPEPYLVPEQPLASEPVTNPITAPENFQTVTFARDANGNLGANIRIEVQY